MKVTLTGATGNVGARISAALSRHGHEVLCLTRRPCEGNRIPYQLGDDPEKLPWQGVDALIHAAYDFAPRRWTDIVERNVDPVIELFRTAAKAGVHRRVFISSLSSFDGCRSNYGKAKLSVESEVLRCGADVIRPGLVWGDGTGGVMAALERMVGTMPVIPYPGGGNTLQFLIHGDDLAESIVRLLLEPQQAIRKPLSLAHPEPLTLLQILKIIARRKHMRRLFIPVQWRMIMAVLKAGETNGFPLPARSDSLAGLVHGLTKPEIDAPPGGMVLRPFE